MGDILEAPPWPHHGPPWPTCGPCPPRGPCWTSSPPSASCPTSTRPPFLSSCSLGSGLVEHGRMDTRQCQASSSSCVSPPCTPCPIPGDPSLTSPPSSSASC